MNLKHLSITLLSALLVFPLSGCQTNSSNQLLAASESQVKLRSIQTRAFDTADKNKMLRAVISTLQDLGFVIDKADESLGTVSATKWDRFPTKMTVSVRSRNSSQLLVRANAQWHTMPIESAVPYQNFFTSLSKSIFLAAHNVE